jgi:uncharacterized protein (TIGR02246 family)
MTTDQVSILGDAFAELAQAWNEADGARYGALFSDDAHFVNIRGEHVGGATAIAHGHQAIFDSIYKGSRVQYSVMASDTISEDCLLGVVRAQLEAPSGPLEGTHQSTITAVVAYDREGWKIRAFPQHTARPVTR